MSEHVAADAQFGVARILKPTDNFEALYQGKQAVVDPVGLLTSIPVPFFEWEDGQPPNPRDDLAGKPGFNPNLMRFLRVPFGALIKLKIPGIFSGVDGITPVAYRYMIVWRDNFLGRYQRTGTGPYHVADERLGAPDTSGIIGPPGPRFLLTGTTRTLLFNRPQSTDPVRGATSDLRREYINVIPGEAPFTPIIGPGPADFGVYQQGVADPAAGVQTGYLPTFMEIVLESAGDEMMIVADRECLPNPQQPLECNFPTWDFAGIDSGFSNIYGRNAFGTPHPPFPNAGIYVYTGTAP